MALPAVTESLDDLPEAIREHYEERNGRFVLSVTPADGLELQNIEGLKKSLADERDKRKKAEQALSPFKDLDPEEARSAMSELAQLREKGPQDVKAQVRAQVEAQVQAEQRKHAEQLKKLESDREEAISQLKDRIRDADIARAMSARKANALLEPHVARFVKVEPDDNGKFRSVVIDETGNPRQALDERGALVELSVDSLVAEMKTNPKYAIGFEPETTGGSGAKPSAGQRSAAVNDRDLGSRQLIEAQYAKTTIRR